ncbi:hypothetical protein SAMN05421813_12716 [Daejeonella rubra]|uniref:CDP-Glycerol:Poly(Glycerophosphate) glycerophosphotransferase n=1 Tax=Daejeonella rubra TaxID=990371 RepID=A0A1G9WUI9_9SPHI|nr:hypothetical protein [Daejeonella rubra]SDM88117.1 hypothetical protein SAMN05421813_12716 [Daejeonella rubra]
MIPENFIRLKKYSFKDIYIIENRACWTSYKDQCSISDDLVLTIDLGLKKDLERHGYHVTYLDHLVDQNILDKANFEIMEFLGGWYKDRLGKNLLEYNGYDIGASMLLNILNKVTYYSHFFYNIIGIKSLKYSKLYVSVVDEVIESVLNDLSLEIVKTESQNTSDQTVYSFPISRWMNEKLNRTTLKERLKDFAVSCLDRFNDLADRFKFRYEKVIYIQTHHPTKRIIEHFDRDKGVKVLVSNYSRLKNVLRERRVTINNKLNVKKDTAILLQRYKSGSRYELKFEEYQISDFLYRLIDPLVEEQLSLALSKIKCIDFFFSKQPISLMVPITHLWMENKLIINYCQKNSIPVFTIINGLLNLSFWNDAKGGDFVNSYSTSIKEDYFENAPNAIPLGDPRMDDYFDITPKNINRENPVIIIGAAGFDLLDLNSYLSFEFDFLYDILSVLKSLKDSNKFKLILKVRPNGYKHLYNEMISEYFPELELEVIQDLSFEQVISKADLYITFYSQTVFEASCIGSPVIYYKKDTQTVDRPFDGASELVTAFDTKTLKEKILAFYNSEPIFDLFLNKKVMEKYIGPLDGKNTARNIDFINSLISNERIK